MKRFLITTIACTCAFISNGQIQYNKVLFSASGNYLKTSTDNGALTHRITTSESELNLDFSVALFISDAFNIEVGVSFIDSKVNNHLFSLQSNDLYLEAIGKNKKNGFLPQIGCSYFIALGKNYILAHIIQCVLG